MSCCDCSGTLEKSNNFYDPLRLSWKKDGELYKYSPILARCKWVPLNTIQGLIKPILFPLWSAVGVVVLPIFAAVRSCQGQQEEAKGWIGAWCFSVLGTGASIIFFIVSANYLSTSIAGGIFMGAIVVSMSIHVWRACRDPSESFSPEEIPLKKA